MESNQLKIENGPLGPSLSDNNTNDNFYSEYSYDDESNLNQDWKLEDQDFSIQTDIENDLFFKFNSNNNSKSSNTGAEEEEEYKQEDNRNKSGADTTNQNDSQKLVTDLDTIEIIGSESSLLIDTFQFEPELAFLDLVNDIFIETSTPTYNLNLLELNESEYYFDNISNKLLDTCYITNCDRFRINDYVCINEKKYGYIKFQGRVHFADGFFCGIELEDEDGKHDGKIDNIRYFQCKPNHGLFAPIEKVKLSTKSSTATTATTTTTAAILSNENIKIDSSSSTSSSSTSSESNSSSLSNLLKLNKVKLTNNNQNLIPYNLNNTFRPIKNDQTFDLDFELDDRDIVDYEIDLEVEETCIPNNNNDKVNFIIEPLKENTNSSTKITTNNTQQLINTNTNTNNKKRKTNTIKNSDQIKPKQSHHKNRSKSSPIESALSNKLKYKNSNTKMISNKYLLQKNSINPSINNNNNGLNCNNTNQTNSNTKNSYSSSSIIQNNQLQNLQQHQQQQQQQTTQQKSSLLNKLSYQLKLKFNPNSTSNNNSIKSQPNDNTENNTTTNINNNNITNRPKAQTNTNLEQNQQSVTLTSLEQSNKLKSKLKAPLSFKQTSTNSLQTATTTVQTTSTSNLTNPTVTNTFSNLNRTNSNVINSNTNTKPSETNSNISNNNLLNLKNQISTSKITNLDDFILNENINLKKNGLENPNSIGTSSTSSTSSTDSSSQLSSNLSNRRSEDNLIGSSSSVSPNSSPSRNNSKQTIQSNTQLKRLSGVFSLQNPTNQQQQQQNIVQSRSSLSSTNNTKIASAIPGLNKITSIPSNTNQHKLVRLSSVNNSTSSISTPSSSTSAMNNPNSNIKPINETHFTSTPNQTKSEQASTTTLTNTANTATSSHFNRQLYSTSSLRGANPGFQSRLSQPGKLGFSSNQTTTTTTTATNPTVSNSTSLTGIPASQPVSNINKTNSIVQSSSNANTTNASNEISSVKQTKLYQSKKLATHQSVITNQSNSNIVTTNANNSTIASITKPINNTIESNNSSTLTSTKNQMNRTFDIDEDIEGQGEEHQTDNILTQSDNNNKVKLKPDNEEFNLVDNNNQKKRESILLFENDSNSNPIVGSLNEEFLENELIPDDLLDEIHNFIDPSSNSTNTNINEDTEFINKSNESVKVKSSLVTNKNLSLLNASFLSQSLSSQLNNLDIVKNINNRIGINKNVTDCSLKQTNENELDNNNKKTIKTNTQTSLDFTENNENENLCCKKLKLDYENDLNKKNIDQIEKETEQESNSNVEIIKAECLNNNCAEEQKTLESTKNNLKPSHYCASRTKSSPPDFISIDIKNEVKSVVENLIENLCQLNEMSAHSSCSSATTKTYTLNNNSNTNLNNMNYYLNENNKENDTKTIQQLQKMQSSTILINNINTNNISTNNNNDFDIQQQQNEQQATTTTTTKIELINNNTNSIEIDNDPINKNSHFNSEIINDKHMLIDTENFNTIKENSISLDTDNHQQQLYQKNNEDETVHKKISNSTDKLDEENFVLIEGDNNYATKRDNDLNQSDDISEQAARNSMNKTFDKSDFLLASSSFNNSNQTENLNDIKCLVLEKNLIAPAAANNLINTETQEEMKKTAPASVTNNTEKLKTVQQKLSNPSSQNISATSSPLPKRTTSGPNVATTNAKSIVKKQDTKANSQSSRVASLSTNSENTGLPRADTSKKPSEPSNISAANALVNPTTSLSASAQKPQYIKKVPSSVAQKTLAKKLKPLSTNVNKMEEDLNSVFETDNHTSSSSDNEESKASSKASTNSIKLASNLRKKNLTKETKETVPAINASSQLNLNQTKPPTSSNLNAQTASSSAKNSSDVNTNEANQSKIRSRNQTSVTSSTKSHYNSSKNNNKENSIPKSIALNKIYKSRDGITAVSSNTSIMSEVSNISKSSLPSSIPTSNAMRNASICSSTSSVKLTNQISLNQANVINKQNSLSLQKPTQTITSQADSIKNQTTNRLLSNSSRQLQSLSTLSKSQTNFLNPNSSVAPQDLRKMSIQHEAKSSALKKPGLLAQNQNLAQSQNDFTKPNQSSMLQINTAARAESILSLSSPASSTSSSKNKNELKLTKEIKRLEALCESRTKELSVLKIQLKETLISFDAMAVAFNYVSNNLNGFEVTSLKVNLNLERKKQEEQVRSLQLNIDEKEKQILKLKDEMTHCIKESNETKLKLEKQLFETEEEYKTQINLLKIEHDLIVKDVKNESEIKTKRLNKIIDTMKIDHEKLVYELKEQIEKKTNENIELEAKIKECEEALAKDKDERIQRLLDIQHNLEKEIESLKAALDIKNLDLFELRTKNNELVTQVDNYNELNMKLRRYKQEVEQLNAILKNKQEAERRACEHNRLLAMKIEVKNRENQRLSMQNEQLQFRLQSQPNLSLTNNDSFNSENTSIITDQIDHIQLTSDQSEQHQQQQQPSITKSKLTRASTLAYHSFNTQNDSNSSSVESQATNSLTQSSLSSIIPENNQTQPSVKLRSKSFKMQLSSKNNSDSNKKLFSSYHQHVSHNQFRPVSENYDFNLTDRDVFMTRSVIMYDSNQANSYLNNNNDFDSLVSDITNGVDLMTECTSGNEGCNSSSSSNSLLENNQDGDILNSIQSITDSKNHSKGYDSRSSSESVNKSKEDKVKNMRTSLILDPALNDQSVVILE